jgi:lauroyl/myristoyl acyltransferase
MAAVQIAEVLRANEVVAIPIDAPIMDPKDLARAVSVDFLGRKARLLPGSALIAKRTGAQTLIAVMRRSSDWRHQVLEISPPIEMGKDPVTGFERCVAGVEAPIHENLAFWDFWQERQMLINMGLAPGEVMKEPRRSHA